MLALRMGMSFFVWALIGLQLCLTVIMDMAYGTHFRKAALVSSNFSNLAQAVSLSSSHPPPQTNSL